MAEAFYSIVLDHPAEAVWATIRPFGHYAWAGVEAETTIEDGKADDQVGAVRHVAMPGRTIRQKLLAHSDRERSYTYSFCEPAPVPNYVATIRVTPVAETDQAFVDWRATFDCAPEERARWVEQFEQKGFAVWLAALRNFMAGSGKSI
jgi:hypothetical protein